MPAKEISKSTLKRLPVYLSYLKSLPEDGPAHISATALAAALSMGEVQVRKDLALVSNGGRPKIGYLREGLIQDIEDFLGYANTNDAVLVGAGKLGRALLGYNGFEEYGLNIVAGAISAVYSIASYTYGPILGLFVFGMFIKNKVRDALVPFVCVASPVVCYFVQDWLLNSFGYVMSFELLLLNAFVTVVGLALIAKKEKTEEV